MLKCTINGKEIEVKEGSTIIEAFQVAGTEIAHYCWHPGLSVAGVCRMCMVSIEGNPRLQIACNTQVTNGMKISNQTDEVKEAVKWALDFHLINHPLDCPICDQAGECGLQKQYMTFGRYEPEMSEMKVKKRKVVDLGPRVVLDTERCILCSRCVRFTAEVTKTDELAIFNRGDRSEIGVFENRPLNNNYSLNTVDICPVGALTSKDFRFKQRVWFLRDAESVCNGCATGCNVRVFYNREGVFRYKPVYNPEVNGYWMCDRGRDLYSYHNRQNRLARARVKSGEDTQHFVPGEMVKTVGEQIKETVNQHGAGSVALVVTAQYTNEELEDMVGLFARHLGSKRVYYWVNHPEQFDEFDGLLWRGDQNPNTKGLLRVLEQEGMTASWSELASAIETGQIRTLVVLGPENQAAYSDIGQQLKVFAKVPNLVWLTACDHSAFSEVEKLTLIPVKTLLEKKGTLINYKGIVQSTQVVTTLVSSAFTLSEIATVWSGSQIDLTGRPTLPKTRVRNEFVYQRGSL